MLHASLVSSSSSQSLRIGRSELFLHNRECTWCKTTRVVNHHATPVVRSSRIGHVPQVARRTRKTKYSWAERSQTKARAQPTVAQIWACHIVLMPCQQMQTSLLCKRMLFRPLVLASTAWTVHKWLKYLTASAQRMNWQSDFFVGFQSFPSFCLTVPCYLLLVTTAIQKHVVPVTQPYTELLVRTLQREMCRLLSDRTADAQRSQARKAEITERNQTELNEAEWSRVQLSRAKPNWAEWSQAKPKPRRSKEGRG